MLPWVELHKRRVTFVRTQAVALACIASEAGARVLVAQLLQVVLG